MKLFRILAFLFILSASSIVQGQQEYEDRLEYLYENIVRTQYSKLDSMSYYISALEKRIKPSDSIWLSKYHSVNGLYAFNKSDYEKSIKEQQKALEIAEAVDNDFLRGKAYQRLGVVYKYQGDYDRALEFFQKARNRSRNAEDWKTVATAEMALCQTHWRLGDIEKATEYIDKALEIAEQHKLKNDVAFGLYLEKGTALYFQGAFDDALFYFKKAESIVQDTQHLEGIAALYSNMGAVMFFKNDLDAAIEYYTTGLNLARDFGDQVSEGIAMINIGEALYNQKKFEPAEKYLKEALLIFKRLGNKRNIVDTYEYLHELEQLKGNHQKALDYFKLKTTYRDSIINAQKLETISNLEVKFETAEKERKITEQNLEIQTQNATIASQRVTQLSLIGGLAFLILGGIFFYSYFRAKQRQKLQAAVLHEKEKGFEAVVKASEDERKRISKDLHDGIGQEMAALKLALHHVKNREEDPEKKEELDKIYESCSKSADGIRDISHEMMPRSLMENGLVNAFEDLLNNSFKYSKISYNFEHNGVQSKRFEERIEICLYRVLQELINNIIKHSGATEMSVLLYKQKNNLILMVDDNGVGMKGASEKGHGVLNMKSRIDMIKGSINFEPSHQSGTSAMIVIPLQ